MYGILYVELCSLVFWVVFTVSCFGGCYCKINGFEGISNVNIWISMFL